MLESPCVARHGAPWVKTHSMVLRDGSKSMLHTRLSMQAICTPKHTDKPTIGQIDRDQLVLLQSWVISLHTGQKASQNCLPEVGERVLQLTALCALPKDHVLVPSSHKTAHKHLSLQFQGIRPLFRYPWAQHTCGRHTYMQADIHTHKVR